MQGQGPTLVSVLPVPLWARWILGTPRPHFIEPHPFLCSRNYQHFYFIVKDMEVYRGEVNKP